ncbi:hypothetical protein Enr13x_30960 [Stieleria neptunia]|uniref:Methyltransferase FkbM domain-containing protein n=1 Tax=Stieleria neptunia TaxID=2527979 RepID=A0A518HR17_9BACT|nr:FkbM family methyltransferase [Stieleria neptunia]QDV43241.1 hypothetical protein Enr13x_30960 [Stieleria neptunia]
MKYYSQFGEDYLLRRVFKEKSKGFYIDVGAHDGINLSNTYLFENLGWSGLCVEANPAIFELCRKARPNATCVNAACMGSANRNSIELYTDPSGFYSGTDSASTRESAEAAFRARGEPSPRISSITVPATTLDKILEQAFPGRVEVDFLSVDVEGAELEVLKGFDIGRYRPRLMVLEANSKEEDQMLDEYAVSRHGYTKARRMYVNNFYVRDPEDVALVANTWVKCRLARMEDELGELVKLGHVDSVGWSRPAELKGWPFVKEWIRKELQFLIERP